MSEQKSPVENGTDRDRPIIAHYFVVRGGKALCGAPYDSVPDTTDGPIEKCVVCRSLVGER